VVGNLALPFGTLKVVFMGCRGSLWRIRLS
ncbi:hypothetical protein A2U01_0114581, partial [Trifolium medium]|nr:hypothetical protein [Trifolium medium]